MWSLSLHFIKDNSHPITKLMAHSNKNPPPNIPIINNNPIIFDCQTGDKYNMESFKKEFDNIIGSASITRLDNIDLNDDFLLRWVRNA